MSGRFHIYLVGTGLDSRSLCPECAKLARWEVQELYERNGGMICSGCGIEPLQYERKHIHTVPITTVQPVIHK